MTRPTKSIRTSTIPYRTAIEITSLAAALAFLAIVWVQPWFDYRLMFLDTLVAATMAEVCCPTWYGSISMLGILVWTSTAAICFVATAVLALLNAPRNSILFCISAGMLTLILALDDAYMLHESVLPKLGVPQTAVLGGLVVITAGYLIGFRASILRHSTWTLIVGLIAFAVSVMVDVFVHSSAPMKSFIEDGSKFIGITAWLVFHSFAALEEILDASEADEVSGAGFKN